MAPSPRSLHSRHSFALSVLSLPTHVSSLHSLLSPCYSVFALLFQFQNHLAPVNGISKCQCPWNGPSWGLPQSSRGLNCQLPVPSNGLPLAARQRLEPKGKGRIDVKAQTQSSTRPDSEFYKGPDIYWHVPAVRRRNLYEFEDGEAKWQTTPVSPQRASPRTLPPSRRRPNLSSSITITTSTPFYPRLRSLRRHRTATTTTHPPLAWTTSTPLPRPRRPRVRR